MWARRLQIGGVNSVSKGALGAPPWGSRLRGRDGRESQASDSRAERGERESVGHRESLCSSSVFLYSTPDKIGCLRSEIDGAPEQTHATG